MKLMVAGISILVNVQIVKKVYSNGLKRIWQTVDNQAAIRDGKTVRYLPKEVWDKLSKEEKEATNNLKVKGSKAGKQRINNPDEVREILNKVHKSHSK